MQGLKNELRGVCIALQDLTEVQRSIAPAAARLDALERERNMFEAEIQGLLLKAEGKLRAATNAEARERANKKSYEHLIDPLDEVGVQPETAGRHPDIIDDAPPSEAERVQALRLDVAPTNKTLAQRAKFGVR